MSNTVSSKTFGRVRGSADRGGPARGTRRRRVRARVAAPPRLPRGYSADARAAERGAAPFGRFAPSEGFAPSDAAPPAGTRRRVRVKEALAPQSPDAPPDKKTWFGKLKAFLGFAPAPRPPSPVRPIDAPSPFATMDPRAKALFGAAERRKTRRTQTQRRPAAKIDASLLDPGDLRGGNELSTAQMAADFTNATTCLAHYLPWYQFDREKEEVGYHWTLNANGFRFKSDGSVAAHDAPMIGPYDSRDRRVIRYHLKLMREAGLRGVVCRWFGTTNGYYYEHNLRAADALLEECCREQMLFTICWEDRAAAAAGSDAKIADRLREDFAYLRDRYFNKSAFIKHGHYKEPLIMLLGPTKITTALPWAKAIRDVFPELADRPRLLVMSGSRVAESAELEVGLMGWLPRKMLPACTLRGVGDYLDDFYEDPACLVGSAFPQYRFSASRNFSSKSRRPFLEKASALLPKRERREYTSSKRERSATISAGTATFTRRARTVRAAATSRRTTARR